MPTGERRFLLHWHECFLSIYVPGTALHSGESRDESDATFVFTQPASLGGSVQEGKKCTRQFKKLCEKALKERKAGVSQAGAYGLGQVSQQRESGIEEHSSRDQVRRGVESV